MHWTRKFIGMPWSREYDCFAFFAEAQEYAYGIKGIADMPDVPSYNSRKNAFQFIENSVDVNRKWRPVEFPRDGDAVLFGGSDDRFHVGIWVNISGQNGVIHCQRSHGVVFTKHASLEAGGTKVEMYLRNITK